MEYDFRHLVGMDFGVGGCNVCNPTLLHVHVPSVCDSLPIVIMLCVVLYLYMCTCAIYVCTVTWGIIGRQQLSDSGNFHLN